MLDDIADSASYNKRLHLYVATLLNGRVLHSPEGCKTHNLHSTITRVSRETDVIGDVHALQSVLSIHNRLERVHAEIRKLVAEELLLVPGVPHPEWRAMALSILSSTVLRFNETTAEANERCPRVTAACKLLPRALNGDWRIQRIVVHPEDPEFIGKHLIHDRGALVDFLVGAIIGCGMFGGVAEIRTIAKARWGSCNEAVAMSNLSRYVHGMSFRILPRTFPEAKPPPRDVSAENMDFKMFMNSKVYRVVTATKIQSKQVFCCALSICTIPIDRLLQALQRQGVRQNVLVDFLHEDTNPYTHCQKSLGN